MRLLRVSQIAGFLFFIAGALSACTVAVEDDGPRPFPPEGPQICTREYAPVCARRGGERRTFGNACTAEAAGFRIIGRGECGPDRDEPRICTQEYDPVCGRRGRDTRTFGNACQADAEGYRVIGRGECRRGDGGRPGYDDGRPGGGWNRPGGDDDDRDRPGSGGGWDRPGNGGDWDRPGSGRPQACTREYAPVCGRRGGDTRSFGNACEAEAAGYRIVREGGC